MKTITITTLCLLCSSMLLALETKESPSMQPDEIVTYKTVTTKKGTFDLKLHIFRPPETDSKARPCIVMFHGGGWNNGAPEVLYNAGKRWSDTGMVAIAVEYRILYRHGGTALDSVRDAKSAIRWIRSQADKLGIDPDKIVAQGGSAGGHLAVACATLTEFNEEGEDIAVSCRPDALILSSPVLDNGPGGYGQFKKEVRENWREFSPFHNIRKGVPPALISVGDAEAQYLRVEIAQELKAKMEVLGSHCRLIVLEGATHTERTDEQQELVQ